MLESAGTALSPTQYIAHVQELTTNVDAVFDIANSNSQIKGLMNGLTTVALAFARLPGMPKNLTKSINKALDSITATRDQATVPDQKKI